MALISFLAGVNFVVNDLAGSGLGFFGNTGFSSSVPVGGYQGHTFITDSTGTVQGPEVSNVKWTHAASGILGQVGASLPLRAIPNYEATLNVRFTNSTGVKTQNVQLRIFDRVNPDNPASGVTTKTAQIIHYSNTQDPGSPSGSGDTAWVTPAGSSIIHSLTASPGMSGLSPSGANTVDTQHDWYIAISASPDTIGSHTNFGLMFSVEYL